VNAERTKYMFVHYHQVEGQNHSTIIGN